MQSEDGAQSIFLKDTRQLPRDASRPARLLWVPLAVCVCYTQRALPLAASLSVDALAPLPHADGAPVTYALSLAVGAASAGVVVFDQSRALLLGALVYSIPLVSSILMWRMGLTACAYCSCVQSAMRS